MAEFAATVYQNEYLAEGMTDVHAIVTISCTGAGTATESATDAAEIVIVDTSGSMQGEKIEAARMGALVAVDQIPAGTWFAIIAGSHVANVIYPYPSPSATMVTMTDQTRAEAKNAVSIAMQTPSGGTAMGTWLRMAQQVFATVPQAEHRHAILLTDGKNEHETPQDFQAAIAAATGAFQCDARGVGNKWRVEELRRISSALLGTVDLIAQPEAIAADFAALIHHSMARGVSSADLRVWSPQGSEVLFVRQVAPRVEDLTTRRVEVNPLTGAYPTGAWGDEERDYHVAIRVPSRPVGTEQLAARVQLSLAGQVCTSGLVKARWSDDEALTTRINAEVAHYTGQTELASAIQEGLAARAVGDEATATVKLGRAVQLAQATGNQEATDRLRKVVDIEDPEQGTVRLRRDVDRLDEMALDTSSTKTTRVRSS